MKSLKKQVDKEIARFKEDAESSIRYSTMKMEQTLASLRDAASTMIEMKSAGDSGLLERALAIGVVRLPRDRSNSVHYDSDSNISVQIDGWGTHEAIRRASLNGGKSYRVVVILLDDEEKKS